MALRPVDLQLSILQATQTAALAQQQLEGPAAAQAATQQRFAAQVQERQENVGVIEQGEFSKIRADEREGGGQPDDQGEGGAGRRGVRHGRPGGPGFADDEHLIDFSA